MKKLFLVFSLLFSVTTFAQLPMPPLIGPVGIKISDKLIKKIESQYQEKNQSEEDNQIQFLLNTGKRASLWLNAVNAHRAPDKQLDFSRPGGSKGIPITEPMKTSTSILMKQYDDFLLKTPKVLTDVLTTSADFPTVPPVSDLEFVDGLRTLDRIYQNTIRWASSKEWISWYINRAIFDVRGYLFLKETPDLEPLLMKFNSLDPEEQKKFQDWLLGLCRNGDFDFADCLAEYKKSAVRNGLFGFYNRFSKYGKNMYDLFYTIKKIRPEIHWNPSKTLLISPFQTPSELKVENWLKENVEDEWKSVTDNSFNLVIDYEKSSRDIPRIQFKEGVTANVNGIAGNLITMEAEYPIESSDQKWTIRHEYGHVLGFEDCYLEFYDTNEKAMIYYEIDVDNLMCSRKGHLKPTHREQLMKAYK